MSSTITPKPDRNSAAKRNATIVQSEPPASGTSTSGAGNTRAPATNAGPTPIRRVDRAERERRDEERNRVRDQRARRGKDLHEKPPDARAGDEREGAAAVQQRVRLEVAVARDERDEQRAVGDEEEHTEGPDQEADDVQLRHRQHPEPAGDRDRR